MENDKPHMVWPIFLVFLGVTIGSTTLFCFAFFFLQEFVTELFTRESASLKLDLLLFAVAISFPAYVLLHIGIRMYRHRIWVSYKKRS